MNYENNAKGHSLENFFFLFFFPLSPLSFLPLPFPLFWESTTTLPGDVYTGWRFPGKDTLPKTFVVIWKPLSAPAVARGTGTAVTRVWHRAAHSLIAQSSLGPLTFQSKLQSSSLSFMEVEKWLKRQKPRLKMQCYGTACFFVSLLRICINYSNHSIYWKSLESKAGALNVIHNSNPLNISENWNIIGDCSVAN